MQNDEKQVKFSYHAELCRRHGSAFCYFYWRIYSKNQFLGRCLFEQIGCVKTVDFDFILNRMKRSVEAIHLEYIVA